MRGLAAVVLVGAVVWLAGYARADDKKDAKDDAVTKLVGKWEVMKSESETPVGTVVEFLKDGKLAVIIKDDGKELKIDGAYKVDKDKLTVSLKIDGQTHDETLTVKTLTADALELIDKDKKLDVLKKLDAAKKK